MTPWWRILLAVLLTVPILLASPASAARPRLSVHVIADGLQIPWDMAFLPDGSMLYTERDRRTVTLRERDGDSRIVLRNRGHMRASGETGLMAIEAAPDFATTRDFLTCHGYRKGAVTDVRVVRWHLNATLTSTTYVRTLVAGLPSTSGRHGGCSLLSGYRNQLYIGTGDAATGRNPQSLTSGGGKVLRVDATTGKAYAGNPFISSRHAMKKRVFTYGHRNVQGLARRADGTLWSVEHGSYRDDEVNRLTKGGNYGWNPVRRRAGDPAYNEGADSPMTDYSLPGKQLTARWRSGTPTVATSGAVFVKGAGWGSWSGALAVPTLGGHSLRLLRFNAAGQVREAWKPAALDGTHGRLRAAVRGPDGALFVSTSNSVDGNAVDQILRISATKP